MNILFLIEVKILVLIKWSYSSMQGIKLKGYYPYFGVQPFTFPSKYFATFQKGRGNFL